MGLGSDEKRIPTYYCSPRAKKDNVTNPHIRVTLYDADGVKHEIQDQKAISGYLVDIDTVEFTPKDKPNVKLKKIVVVLADQVKGELALFRIELLADGHWGRQVMNSILGTPDAQVIKIGVWTDKKGNANIGVKNNNQLTEWRFGWHEDIAPKIYEVEDPKNENEKIKVYKNVNKMFMDAWVAHRKHVRDTAMANGWLEDDGAGDAPVDTPAPARTPSQPDRDVPPIDTHEPIEDVDEMPF